MSSLLDKQQILQGAYDEPNKAIQTENIGQLIKVAYDYISVTYPSGTQEVYVFKSGGSGGSTVATITVNYTDSTKAAISNVAKT